MYLTWSVLRAPLTILTLLLGLVAHAGYLPAKSFKFLDFDFYGNPVKLTYDQSMIIDLPENRDDKVVGDFCRSLLSTNQVELSEQLRNYKEKYSLDDWLYYQLVRRVAQLISPKADDYYRYTLYKWFLLVKSGYSVRLKMSSSKLLFYVQSDDNIYDIPYYGRDGKQYVCLNYHDYGYVDFTKELFAEVEPSIARGSEVFTYKVSRLPEFSPDYYQEKDLQFSYNDNTYHFKVRLNQQIRTIFANYPCVDYASYINIPMSGETYRTLIPLLKKAVKGFSLKNGADYLMRFTRYAFMFETDTKIFGKEKRLSPEQTLLYEQSDCEDRAALFFYLMKEIYDVPMIVLAYPQHVTIAVKLDKSIGKPVMYNGIQYTVCDPTPQKQDLAIGQLPSLLDRQEYEVVYSYSPQNK